MRSVDERTSNILSLALMGGALGHLLITGELWAFAALAAAGAGVGLMEPAHRHYRPSGSVSKVRLVAVHAFVLGFVVLLLMDLRGLGGASIMDWVMWLGLLGVGVAYLGRGFMAWLGVGGGQDQGPEGDR